VTYRAELGDVAGLRIADLPSYAENNCWMIPLQVDATVFGRDRDTTIADLSKRGIQARPLWQLNHLQAPYASCRAWNIQRASRLLESTINLPCSVGLKPDELRAVVDALKQ
jgi:dTDP-4-amino-4,6-dideoxygalactose transaminase